MRVLELFKGSGSITKYYKDRDVEVISLDILEKYEPTIISDIMDFDYKKYPTGYFDIIWASPECKVYSSANNMNIGQKQKYKCRDDLIKVQKEDSKFINKTIEIIDKLQPTYYFVENPLGSQIWKYIDNHEYINKFVVVDYCYFGYDYKKPTKILTNKKLLNKRCKCKSHIAQICSNGKINGTRSLEQKYSIPQPLLTYLLDSKPDHEP